MTWNYLQKEEVVISRETWGDFFRRHRKKRSALILVVGAPGKGKSLAVASSCEIIDHRFSPNDFPRSLKGIKSRLKEKIDNAKAGNDEDSSLLNLDDFGRQLDPNRFNSASALALSWIFQTYRTLGQIVFLTIPDDELVNKTFRKRLSNFKMEVLGHNERTGYAKIKFVRLQKNQSTKRVYEHNLFLTPFKKLSIIKREGYVPVSRFYIQKPSKEFLDWYFPFREQIAIDNLDDLKEDEEMIAEYEEKQKTKSEDKERGKRNKEKERIAVLEEQKKKVKSMGNKAIIRYHGKKIVSWEAISASLGVSREKARLLVNLLAVEDYPKQE